MQNEYINTVSLIFTRDSLSKNRKIVAKKKKLKRKVPRNRSNRKCTVLAEENFKRKTKGLKRFQMTRQKGMDKKYFNV